MLAPEIFLPVLPLQYQKVEKDENVIILLITLNNNTAGWNMDFKVGITKVTVIHVYTCSRDNHIDKVYNKRCKILVLNITI